MEDFKKKFEELCESKDSAWSVAEVVTINMELEIGWERLFTIREEDLKKILSETRLLHLGTNSLAQFRKAVEKIEGFQRVRMMREREEDLRQFRELFTENCKHRNWMHGMVANDVKPHHVDRLRIIMTETWKKCKPLLVEFSLKFASNMNCENIGQFIGYAEYASNLVASTGAKISNHPSFKREFILFGMRGLNMADYKDERAMLYIVNNLDSIFTEYRRLREECRVLNGVGEPGFGGDILATYHYAKHKHENMTAAQYFQAAKDLANSGKTPAVQALTQDGKMSCSTIIDANGKKRVVVLETLKEPKNRIIATYF